VKTLCLSSLLAVSLLVASALLQVAVSDPTPQQGYLAHYTFYVKPGDLVRYDFDICEGCSAIVIFYVYDREGNYIDIVFRVLSPDGREIYPRAKVDGKLSWSFTATQGGRYAFEFDNTYSILTGKYVDLALAVVPPPRTVTATSTLYYYTILTMTVPTTVPITYTKTVTSYVPTTVTVPIPTTTTTTIAVPTTFTATQVVERVVPTVIERTLTSVQTAEVLRTLTTTATVTERVTELTSLVIVAAALLALGIVLGYVLRGVKR